MATQRYVCTRCGHEVLIGEGQKTNLQPTASPTYMSGVCDGCTQKALNERKPVSSKPSQFRLRP